MNSLKSYLNPVPASYTPMLHDMEVPELHDLLLSLIDISELLDLLQWEQSRQTLDQTWDRMYSQGSGVNLSNKHAGTEEH